MKALLTSAVVAMLLVAGTWAALRRRPSGALLDDNRSPFQVEVCGSGRLLKFQDSQIPLRALRWIGPLPGGTLVAQVLTQSDRQQVVLFKDGQPGATLLVAKPIGLSDSFWRFACLKDALMIPGGLLVLLYTPLDPASGDGSLAVALDPDHGEVRWSHRGPFQRLVLTEGGDPALYCFGPKGPLQRLALAGAGQGSAGRSGPNAAARSLDLAPEMGDLDDLLATGGGNLLVSHGRGLSAWHGKQGWTHFPLPEGPTLPCQDWHSSLHKAGTSIWWQASPGHLQQVHADGSPLAEWTAPDLAADDPWALDPRLLRLVGADPGGALWFALATPAAAAPVSQTPAATPVPGSAAAPTADASSPSPEPAPAPDWPSYLAKGLGRVYRWDPSRQRLDRLVWPQVWAALKPPPELAPPAAGQGLRPQAGALLVEGPRSVWVLPLAALPWQPAPLAPVHPM